MNRDHVATSMVALMLVFTSAAQAESLSSPMLNTKAIEQAIGKPGEMKDEVYKVSLPRKDLSVALNGIQLKPGFALGTWFNQREEIRLPRPAIL